MFVVRNVVRTARNLAPALGVGMWNLLSRGVSSEPLFAEVESTPLADERRRFPSTAVNLFQPPVIAGIYPWASLPFSYSQTQPLPLPEESQSTAVSTSRGISFTPTEVEAIRRETLPLPLMRFNRLPIMPQGLHAAMLFYPYLPAMAYSPATWLLMPLLRLPRTPMPMPLYRPLSSSDAPESDDLLVTEEEPAMHESELTELSSSMQPLQQRTISMNQETIDRLLANPALLQKLMRSGQLSISPVLGTTALETTPPAFRVKLFGYSTVGELVGTPPVLRFAGGASVSLPKLSAALTGLPEAQAYFGNELALLSSSDAPTFVWPLTTSGQSGIWSSTLFIDPTILDDMLQRQDIWQGFLNSGQLLISPVPGTTVLDAPSALSLTIFGYPTMARATDLSLQPPALQLTGGAVIPLPGKTLALPGIPNASPYPSVKASPHLVVASQGPLREAMPLALEPAVPQVTPKHATPFMRRSVASPGQSFTPPGHAPIKPFTAPPYKPPVVTPDERVAPPPVIPAPNHPLPASDDHFRHQFTTLDKTTRRVSHARVKKAVEEVKRTVTALHEAGEDPQRLADEVDRTTQLLTAAPGKQRDELRQDYERHGAELQKHPSRLWQALGVAMMVLGAAIAAIGIVAIVGTMGIGTAPGIGMTVGGTALLAAGIGLFAANTRKSSPTANPEDTPDNTPEMGKR